MKIKHYFNFIICILVMAAGMQLSSCSEGSDQDNIVKLLNDNRNDITQPFEADTVIFKGDTVRIKVYVDTDYKPLTEILKNANSISKDILAKVKENAGKNDSIDEQKYDFSISSPNCIFSITYNNYAAIKIADYFNDKGDKSDKVIVSELFNSKDKKSLSSVQLPKSNYHNIIALLNNDYSKEDINGMFSSAVKAEHSLKIKDLILPQLTDEFTTLYKIVINDDTYDFYFSISNEVSGMLDEDVMNQIGKNVSSSVSEPFDKLNNAEKIKSDLEILNKEVIYHYSVRKHDDENYRFTFKFPKLNSYILEKE